MEQTENNKKLELNATISIIILSLNPDCHNG